jgi:probable F420-dependent oxidoreductase
VRFIFQYPETHGTDGDMLDPGPVAEVAAAAEAAGWHGFSFTEHPIPGTRWLAAGGHQSLDPFAALAHAAAVTTELRLLTNLAVVPYRNPFLLARAAATVDKLSDGRFILGAGTGYLKTEFHALGVDFDERNALFDETLDVLPRCWSGESFSYRGRHFDARDVIALPRPVQRPIPIWIGGNSRLTLRRVATRAQGWLPMLSFSDISTLTRTPHLATIDDLARRIADLRELAGARAPTLDVAAAYSDPAILAPDRAAGRHRATIASLAEAGVTWLIVQGPALGPEHTLAFLAEFAETYIAR